MRVLWVDPLNTNPHYLNLMAAVVRDAGHDVRVCSVQRDRHPPPSGVVWAPFARAKGPLVSFRSRPLTMLRLALCYRWYWRRAIRYASECGVTAVVVSTNLRLPRGDAWALGALSRRGIAAVVVVHKPWQSFFAGGKAKASYRRFYRAAARVLTMDDRTGGQVQATFDLPAERCGRIPHPHFQPILEEAPADPALAARLAEWVASPEATAGRAPVIAFLSQMRAEQGFEDLRAALPRIDAELAEWRLLIVSSNLSAKRQRRVEDWLARERLRDRCWLHWAAYSNAELRAFLAVADLVVVPYRQAGRSAVTALAAGMGLPIVAADVGGLATGIRSGVNGEVVAAGDPQALAAGVVAVVRRLEDYRAGARRPNPHYSPALAADALAAALRDAAQVDGAER